MGALKAAAGGRPIEVATLESLNDEEAEIILRALGETDPERFLQNAHVQGAEAFLQNPLSLRLLRSAVTDGGWPRRRFDLFEKAVHNLAHEDNPARRRDPQRPPAPKLVEAAGAACLVMLLGGARSLWWSTAIPPIDAAPVDLLPLESGLIDKALDTPLFRGEDEEFEPAHRTIAEFLAARALARAVVGGPNSPRYPLARAFSLFVAADGKAPTELRGLFAWLAAHLTALGDSQGARRLIEADPATVLAYGDAAVFDTHSRREILYGLGRDDPYFRLQPEATVRLSQASLATISLTTSLMFSTGAMMEPICCSPC